MKRKEILRFALNDKLIVNCQWLIVMRGTRFPSAEEHPPSPPFKGGEEQSEALGKKHRISAEGCKPYVTIVVHSYVHYEW